MKNKTELLLPAGDLSCLKTAVKYGADAVYFGAEQFSARAHAANFTDEAIREGVAYCHRQGAKAYCAVNTLIFNEEVEEALDLVYRLAEAGVDAIIVQDLGLARLIHEALPEMPLHGSTQMVVHNSAGAKALAELGFERVVLARECTLDEIQKISETVDIELEVFIHGALCISYSGACYMSSFQGGRSGNRGDCAQPCRMAYELVDSEGHRHFAGYPLSTKDLNALDRLDALTKLGVASLKIEGRMKRPEYIAATTQAYRKALDAALDGERMGARERAAHQKVLAQVFNRNGFTTAHWDGKAYAGMMSLISPKNTGRAIGHFVAECKGGLLIALDDEVLQGDGYALRAGDGTTIAAGYIEGMEVGGQRTEKALRGETIFLPAHLDKAAEKGAVFYKTFDRSLARLLKAPTYERQTSKPLMHFYLYAEVGKPLLFQVNTSDDETLVTIDTDFIVAPAKNRGADEAQIIAQLERLGETPFAFGSLFFEAKEAVFLPASLLNRLRREAVAYYGGEEEALPDRETFMERAYDWLDRIPPGQKNPVTPRLAVSVAGPEAALALLDADADEWIVSVTLPRGARQADEALWSSLREKAASAGKRLTLTADAITSERHFQALWTRLERLQALGFERFAAGNIGLFEALAKAALFPELIADYTMNATNDLSLHALMQDGASEVILSPEMGREDIAGLSFLGNLPLGLPVAGAFSLMTSEYCAIGSLVAGTMQGEACPAPCLGSTYHLVNKEGQSFPLATDEYCRMHVLGDRIYSLHRALPELSTLGLDCWRIEGRFLNSDLLRALIGAFRGQEGARAALEALPHRFTDSFFKRGIRK